MRAVATQARLRFCEVFYVWTFSSPFSLYVNGVIPRTERNNLNKLHFRGPQGFVSYWTQRGRVGNGGQEFFHYRISLRKSCNPVAGALTTT